MILGLSTSIAKAEFINLPYGKYTYQEITAPDGYVLDDTEYTFEIKENGEIIKVSVTNKKKAMITKNR